MHRRFLALALAGVLAGASATEPGAPPGTPDNRNLPDVQEWKEAGAPPPPPLRTQGLIQLEVARATMRFGIDPASITVGADQVVRYVVVATSSGGTVNAFYEGIRCATGQVKVFAHHDPERGWVPTPDADWRDIFKTPNSRHSLAIARSGACHENAPNGSPTQIAQDLRAPIDRRFQRGGVNR